MIQAHPLLDDSISYLRQDENWKREKWFALYTRSRHEKLADRELRKKGIETFLPLRSVTRSWSDRRKTIQEPLFQGYLFVRIPWSSRLSVLNTTGVASFVGRHASEPFEIPEHELLTVRKFINENIQIDPFPYLKQGERVYIRSGPFKGVEGFILRKDNHCRLILSLDLLMQSVSIQIDEACVEQV